MLQIKDFRETKAYQEALEEGRKRTREEIALRLLAEDFSVPKIVALTGLPQRQVRILRKNLRNYPRTPKPTPI